MKSAAYTQGHDCRY